MDRAYITCVAPGAVISRRRLRPGSATKTDGTLSAAITALMLALLLCPVVLTPQALAASSTTVYRWVDDNGKVRFSDRPPNSTEEVDRLLIDVPAPQPDDLQQKRLEAMRTTTDRMAADRMAREKHRAELRSLARQSREPASSQPGYYDPLPYAVGSYWRPGRRYPGTIRPHPGHPAVKPPLVRPPLRPQPRAQPRANSYPASLVRRHYNPRVQEALRR